MFSRWHKLGQWQKHSGAVENNVTLSVTIKKHNRAKLAVQLICTGLELFFFGPSATSLCEDINICGSKLPEYILFTPYFFYPLEPTL